MKALIHCVKSCGNIYFLLGVVLGLFFHANLTYFNCKEYEENLASFERADVFQRQITPKLIKNDSINGTRKNGSKIVRPRYYSTELGIRDKLFVGKKSNLIFKLN